MPTDPEGSRLLLPNTHVFCRNHCKYPPDGPCIFLFTPGCSECTDRSNVFNLRKKEDAPLRTTLRLAVTTFHEMCTKKCARKVNCLYNVAAQWHPLSLSRERTILELPREQTLVRTQNITRFALLATLRQIIAYSKH